MKRFAPILLVLLCVGIALSSWPVQMQQAMAPMAVAALGSTPLHEVDVATLETNLERAQYIRAAAIRQYQLVELYTNGTIVVQGHTFAATPATITAIKQQFAALRTRVKAAEDAITGD